MLSKQQLLAGLVVWCLASMTQLAGAQDLCRGDVNDNGIVDTADAAALPALLFDADEVEPQVLLQADGNDDAILSAADVVAVLRLNGMPCAPTLTPTRTPTRPTATPTPPPTITSTPTSTPSPTPTCMIQNLPLGTTNGELTTGDCPRQYGDNDVRYTDVYAITGTPGQAIMIAVVATAATQPIAPFVEIIDAGGQFGAVFQGPPVEFIVTTSQPYYVYVTSAPRSAMQLGTYQVTASVRSCPTPIPLTLPTTARFGALDATHCPDPGIPGANGSSAVDTYTFTVGAAQVPLSLQILMRQTNYNDDINPVFSVIGPDGYELFSPDEDDDSAPAINSDLYPFTDAGARFLATVPGTYTLLAGGNGGFGSYLLSVLTPGAPACVPKALGTIPSASQLVMTGQLFGDFSKGCSPPVPIPGVGDGLDDQPEPLSSADIYTFTASAGDVISARIFNSDDEPHVFLYGPASAGNPLVAQDDDNQSFVDGEAQIAATLASAGTYTIVAANDNALDQPDPSDPTDQGQIVNYTLAVQKCPIAGGLTADVAKNSTFSSLDCQGFGGLPFRSYGFIGKAGQFVSVSMTSQDVDPAVRLVAPDGSKIYNDNDLFVPQTTDARINRILPVDGVYFVEVSTSLASGPVDLTPPLPGFSVQVQTCPTTAAVPGIISGSFQNSDCELTPGRKYDVYTFAGPAAPGQRAASILPPINGCVVGLNAQGLQTPDGGCSADLVEMPVVTSGTYGFMVAAGDETVRGTYLLRLANCPLSTVTFGDIRNGALDSNSCTGADGMAAGWYLMRGAADLVNFNTEISGAVTPGFGGMITDFTQAFGFLGRFADGSDQMLPLGRDLAALIKVTGPTPASYQISIDQPALRQ